MRSSYSLVELLALRPAQLDLDLRLAEPPRAKDFPGLRFRILERGEPAWPRNAGLFRLFVRRVPVHPIAPC